jgi:hypothetical protein
LEILLFLVMKGLYQMPSLFESEWKPRAQRMKVYQETRKAQVVWFHSEEANSLEGKSVVSRRGEEEKWLLMVLFLEWRQHWIRQWWLYHFVNILKATDCISCKDECYTIGIIS